MKSSRKISRRDVARDNRHPSFCSDARSAGATPGEPGGGARRAITVQVTAGRCLTLLLLLALCSFATVCIPHATAQGSEDTDLALTEKDIDRLVAQFDKWVFDNGKRDKVSAAMSEYYVTSISRSKKDFERLTFLTEMIWKSGISPARLDSEVETKDFFERINSKNYYRFDSFTTGTNSNPDIILLFSESDDQTRKFINIEESISRDSLIAEEYKTENCSFKRYRYHEASLKTVGVIRLRDKTETDYLSAYACYLIAHLVHLGVPGALEDVGPDPQYFFRIGAIGDPNAPLSERSIYLRYWKLFPLWALYRKQIYPGQSRESALESARELAPLWGKWVGVKAARGEVE